MTEATPMKENGPRRLLFKPPSWSKAQVKPETATEGTSGDLDLFTGSRESYKEILREQQERAQKKELKKEKERQKLRLEEVQRDSKRRRISSEDASTKAEGNSPAGKKSKERTLAKADPTSPQVDLTSPRPSYSDRYQAKVAAAHSEQTQNDNKPISQPIELSDSDEAVIIQTAPIPKDSTTAAKAPIDILDDSDEEFPELRQRARERARLRAAPAAAAAESFISSRTSTTATSPGPSPPNSNPKAASLPPVSFTTNSSIPKQPLSTSSPVPDTIVKILITSPLPSTVPILIKRKLTQRLKDVRAFWCARQKFDDDKAASIFFTWRGKRVFDVTTCKSLGIGDGCQDEVIDEAGEDADGMGDELHVRMEAMTDEEFTKARRERERGRALGTREIVELDNDGDGEEDTEGAKETEEEARIRQEKEAQVRIILKSRDNSDYRIIVRPTTTVARMLGAFRGVKDIPAERSVYVVFDGERLADDTTIADADIGDLDELDVHIK